jgi:hypothetical protein
MAVETAEQAAVNEAVNEGADRNLEVAKRNVLRAAAAVDKVTAKFQEQKLTAIYSKSGLMVTLKAYITAGGKLTALVDRKSEAGTYNLLSEVKRVEEAFGMERPARFTAWSAIVAAVKMTPEQLDAIDGDLTLDKVKSARPKAERAESASQDGNGESQPEMPTVGIEDAPAGVLFTATAELIRRARGGELTADEVKSAQRLALLLAEAVKGTAAAA